MFFGILFFFHKTARSGKIVMLFLFVPSLLVVGYFTLKEYVAIIWFIGVASARIFISIEEKPINSSLLLAMLISLAGFCYRLFLLKHTEMNMYDLQLNTFLCAFLFFVLLAFSQIRPAPRITWITTKIAFISYALYLSHDPIRRVLVRFLAHTPPTILDGLLLSAPCIAVAFAISYFLENKHLSLRVRLKKNWE